MNDLDIKIANAMHRIEDLYYQTGGKCYLSFSGGKDSTVILAIIKMCEEIYTLPPNAIPAVFSDTGIELGATKDFVKWVKENWYENAEIIKPEKTFSWVINNKENDIKGYILGERIAEGGIRATGASKRINEGGKICTKTKGDYIVKLPIIDWSNEDIEMFIKKYNVPLSKAYTEEGYERTGCFLCPFSLQVDKNLEKLYRYEPNRYKAAMFYLKDVYIAQNVILPFDDDYERERKQKWKDDYEQMRYEMLEKYRPEISHKFNNKQMSLDDFL